MTRGPVRPVKLQPRLDPKPWGGRLLEAWGIPLPPGETIGEALLTDPEATVASGAMPGTPLGELASRDPAAWIGARGLEVTGGQPIFPLLVKLIDGQADLSIQVHPDDRAAAAAGLGTGKTEAYHILAAEPGSVIYLGLDPEVKLEEFASSCLRANGSAAGCLRQVPAEAGDDGADPGGDPPRARRRDPHLRDPAALQRHLPPRRLGTGRRRRGGARAPPPRRTRPRRSAFAAGTDPARCLGRCDGGPGAPGGYVLFRLERIALAEDAHVRFAAVDSPQVLTPIAGAVLLDAAGWVGSAAAGETVILPAGQGATLSARRDSVVLRGWVPDLEREVMAPARAAGASDGALRSKW